MKREGTSTRPCPTSPHEHGQPWASYGQDPPQAPGCSTQAQGGADAARRTARWESLSELWAGPSGSPWIPSPLFLSSAPLPDVWHRPFPPASRTLGGPSSRLGNFTPGTLRLVDDRGPGRPPTRQNRGLGLGKARGWTRMIFMVSSSSPRPAATLPVPALLGIAVP